MNVRLTIRSENRKLGPMPVSTVSPASCPPSCPLNKNGCYADYGPLNWLWRAIDTFPDALDWDGYCEQVRKLPQGTLWRHAQAGDLCGQDDRLDADACMALAQANVGRRGFGYTHYPPTTWNISLLLGMQKMGFTISLSADSLEEADSLYKHGLPVVTLLPRDYKKLQDERGVITTPGGKRVVVCPAVTKNTTCWSCGLCARQRAVIVGFPAHGTGVNKAIKVFNNGN